MIYADGEHKTGFVAAVNAHFSDTRPSVMFDDGKNQIAKNRLAGTEVQKVDYPEHTLIDALTRFESKEASYDSVTPAAGTAVMAGGGAR